MARVLLSVLLGCAAAAPASAMAQGPDWERNWAACRNTQRDQPVAEVVAACTALLSSQDMDDFDRAEALANRAIAYRAQHAWRTAVADYRAALRINPDFEWLHAGLGATYREMGEPRRAIGEYDIALRRLNTRLGETPAGPARDDVATRLAFGYYGRGLAHAMLNENREALPDFRAAVRGAPDEPQMANGLCWTLAALGESLDEARGACDAALRLRPDFAEALDSRGLLNLRQQRFEEAWRDYDAALRLTANAMSSRYGRGIAALRLGRTAEGQADIAAALAAAPDLAATYAGYGIRP
jgi:tetratricopeptide (TPR) repeat protein